MGYQYIVKKEIFIDNKTLNLFEMAVTKNNTTFEDAIALLINSYIERNCSEITTGKDEIPFDKDYLNQLQRLTELIEKMYTEALTRCTFSGEDDT